MDAWTGFLYGAIGGTLPEFYALYKLREQFHASRPEHILSVSYWVLTALMIIVGGLCVLFYMEQLKEMTPTLAIHLGAATPALIQGFLAKKPNVEDE